MFCQGTVTFAIVDRVKQSSFIETFVDIPRTYHSFSYRHEVKSIHDVITYYAKCMLYKFLNWAIIFAIFTEVQSWKP
jgi:hypothetical protein